MCSLIALFAHSCVKHTGRHLSKSHAGPPSCQHTAVPSFLAVATGPWQTIFLYTHYLHGGNSYDETFKAQSQATDRKSTQQHTAWRLRQLGWAEPHIQYSSSQHGGYILSFPWSWWFFTPTSTVFQEFAGQPIHPTCGVPVST